MMDTNLPGNFGCIVAAAIIDHEKFNRLHTDQLARQGMNGFG